MPKETIEERVNRHLGKTYQGDYLSQEQEQLRGVLERIVGHRHLNAIRCGVARDLLDAVESKSGEGMTEGGLTVHQRSRRLKEQLERLEKCDRYLKDCIKSLKRTKAQVKKHGLLENYVVWTTSRVEGTRGTVSFSKSYSEGDFLKWLDDLETIADKLDRWDTNAIREELANIHAAPGPWDAEAEEVNEQIYFESRLKAKEPNLTKEELEQRLNEWAKRRRPKAGARRLAIGELLPTTQKSILDAFSWLSSASVGSRKSATAKELGRRFSLITDMLIILNFDGLNPFAGKEFNKSGQRTLQGKRSDNRRKLYDKLRHLIKRGVKKK